ncbi:MAG: Clp protease N-terminal domain-containing protein [Candidatus Melainabacteria bacterium]|nr:Clp protease N-terminal domain-containing protein [Candidatus Melainabacteria bacterium]
MFERFTEKAIKVIMLAQEEARRLNHNFVGTEQLLLGLLGEGSGIAARALRKHNVELEKAREEVEKIIGRGTSKVGIEIPFTPRSKRVLEAAWDEARSLSVTYIGTEHLLLGLLKDDIGVAIQVLKALEVDADALRETTMDLTSRVLDSINAQAEGVLNKCESAKQGINTFKFSMKRITEDISELCQTNKMSKSDALAFKEELKRRFATIAETAKQICLPEVFDFSQELSKIDRWIETLE